VKESIGSDQLNTWVLWPASKQGLQNAGRSTFPNRNTARDANDVGHLWSNGTQEGCRHAMQVLSCTHIQVQEASERQIDSNYFFEVNAVVDSAQCFKVSLMQCEWCLRTKLGPIVSIKSQVSVYVNGVNHESVS
jgi:hypothetical protein